MSAARNRRNMTLPMLPPANQHLVMGELAELDSKTKILMEGQEVEVAVEDLGTICKLGEGTFGYVDKVVHRPTGFIMAVKRIVRKFDDKETKRLIMELHVSARSQSCPYTVQFYGAMYWENTVWICTELMTTSMDKFYSEAFAMGYKISETVLRRIAYSAVHALSFLEEQLHVIHRDVKPSNILINRQGDVKLCDYGISGKLIDSLAITWEAGCTCYLPPERIDPEQRPTRGYDVRSDVWSLGVTMVEMAIGKYPYTFTNVYDLLSTIVSDAPPQLPPGQFSSDFESFINTSLQKDYNCRPKYEELMKQAFICNSEKADIDIEWLNQVLDHLNSDTTNSESTPIEI